MAYFRIISDGLMGSYPSWLRRFTVNKLAMATACSTHAYPIQKYKREIDYQLINTIIRVGT
jgi:hypothetical protein